MSSFFWHIICEKPSIIKKYMTYSMEGLSSRRHTSNLITVDLRRDQIEALREVPAASSLVPQRRDEKGVMCKDIWADWPSSSHLVSSYSDFKVFGLEATVTTGECPSRLTAQEMARHQGFSSMETDSGRAVRLNSGQ